MRALSFACALVVAAASVARAQDPAIVDPGHYKLVVNAERTRVFHVLVPAGEDVARHGHPDAIMIPLSFPPARGAEAPEAILFPAQTHGGPGSAPRELVEFIYVELKEVAPSAAARPAREPGINSTRLVTHRNADAFRVTLETGFHEPAGTMCDDDQVLVALDDAEVALTVDGKMKDTWKRGDVAYIGRHVKYEAKNTGHPANFVVVAIK